MNKKNIAVVFGGRSSEYEVSCRSAAAMIDNLDEEKYEVYKVGITREGEWFLSGASSREIADGSWLNSDKTGAFISPDRGRSGLITAGGDIPVDCVLLAVHGRNCEDGVLQGLLECSGIPYTGSGVTSSACSMDKSVTKLMLAEAGIDQADFQLVTDRDKEAAGRVETYFKGSYPLFVKPANEGSSVGVTKAHNREELEAGLKKALTYDSKALVEETIVGRELEAAVLGNDKPQVARIGEILAANDFYDYDAKYVNAASKTVIPDDLDPETDALIRETAARAFITMGCRGYARVDFFLTDAGRVVLNEINTLPGFTSISMFPQMWRASGMTYGELLDRLIELAMEDR